MCRGRWVVALGWAVAVLSLAGQVVVAVSSPAPDHFADLDVYQGAIRSLLAGRGLYGFAAANGDPFTYPPFAALLLVPFAGMSDGVAQGVWTALQVVAVLALARLCVRACVRPTWCLPELWLPVVVTVLAVSAPVASAIHFGQISLLVTLAAAATLVEGRSGAWAGLAAAVKLTPLILVPPIAARRQRDAAVLLATFVAASAVAWVVVPDASVQFWFHELPSGRYGHESLVGNQSWAGLLARHPLPGPPALVAVVTVGVRVVVLALGGWRAVHCARGGRGGGWPRSSSRRALVCCWLPFRGRTIRRRC